MEYQIGDRVKDWNGDIGIVEITRQMEPTDCCSHHAITPYQRIRVTYPNINGWAWTEGASRNYSPA